jgi:flagellar basal body-associated protein FliL
MAATTASSLVPKKKNNLSLLVGGVLLLAVAGAGFWYYRTKMNPSHAASESTSSRPAENAAVQAVTLEPFLANLSGGEGYVKVTITLSVRKAGSSLEGAKEKAADASAVLLQSAIVRDTILADLATQTAGVLLTAEGKAALKTQLKSDLIAKVPGLALDNLYFTDFLVQQ